MKIHSKTTRPLRRIILCILVLLIALASWLFWSHTYQQWPFSSTSSEEKPISTIDYKAPTKQQSETGTSTKEKVAEKTKEEDSQEASAAQSSTIPVTITTVQPGETVYVRALISSITSTATCQLTMSGPDYKTYSASTGTQALADSSTCQGFNIPMSSLAAGNWKITIKVIDGQNKGASSTEKTL